MSAPTSRTKHPSAGAGAIIAAGGVSSRMGGIDKLFAPIRGRPLLHHTLTAFEACEGVATVVLVVSRENVAPAERLVRDAGLKKVARVCTGGVRRRDSVRAGLDALDGVEWVVVHDGARPLVTPALVEAGLSAAAASGAAVCALPAGDTVKQAGAGEFVAETLDRSRIWLAQTPQVFRLDLLRRAHAEDPKVDATDDAALVERLGVKVKLYRGSPRNIKVTTPEDLALAQALLAATS